ncbi:hypothetical protein HK405_012914, partial [Cladochytrium tenue]
NSDESKRCSRCGHSLKLHEAVSSVASGEKLSWQEKISRAGQERNLSGASYYIIRNCIVWSIVTALGAWYNLTQPPNHPEFDRGVSDEFYLYNASAFAVSFLYACISYFTSKPGEKKELSKILICINFVAFISYVIQAYRLTPSFLDFVGHPCDVSRFFEWFATCPILVYLIAAITRNNQYASVTATFDYALLTAGLLAAMAKQPYSELFATISTIFYCYTLYNLMEMYNSAIRGETPCQLDPQSLYNARGTTFIAWNMFTIVWYIQRSEMVTYEVGEILFCISDLFGKVFLTIILVNATLEESTNNRFRKISDINSEMEQQMAQSDKLLEKLMPPGLIDQLKNGSQTGAEEFESVTVFFSDITNFPALSATLDTREVLSSLDRLWQEYDVICRRWGIYKVETIGDAFLGVVGAPQRVPDHAKRAAFFAIDVIKMARTFCFANGMQITTRVGLNSGPITAGVLGDINPHWCIVGDTVNTASRMESTSKPMKIHISESTYRLIEKENISLSGPEEMNIKGKGIMQTYWINVD